MALLTSPDQRCLFCASTLGRYPIVDGPGKTDDERPVEILWSDCLECGFPVPTSTPDLSLVLGERERVGRLLDEDRAVLLLPPPGAAVHFHPAEPSQLLQACRRAGFREVHLELLAERDVDPSEMPAELPDGDFARRRHHSAQGGLPWRMPAGGEAGPGEIHEVRDLAGLSGVARALEAGAEEFGFVDVLPFEDSLGHPGLEDPYDLFQRREIADRFERGRSDEPVVEPAEGLDLTATFEEGEVATLEVEDAAPMLARMGVRLKDLLPGSRRLLSTCPFRMDVRYQGALEDIRHDAVTGALSYSAFRERLEEEMARATRHDTRIAMLLFDLDAYEEKIEEHGRATGKALMSELGQIVDSSTRHTDVLGRIGSDTIGVVLTNPTPEGAAKVADKIRDRAEESTTELDGTTLEGLTVSVGLAYQRGESRAGLTAEDPFAEADASLLHSGSAGREPSPSLQPRGTDET